LERHGAVELMVTVKSDMDRDTVSVVVAIVKAMLKWASAFAKVGGLKSPAVCTHWTLLLTIFT